MNTQAKLKSLDLLRFDNRFVNELPADPERGNFTRQVVGACYSKVLPTPVSQPKLVAYSQEVVQLLDLDETVCGSADFVQAFSGNKLLHGMAAHATCYGGHQFGAWAGQLGDGRVINLGDVINAKGERWALQLKGAGLTPYSRHADGLAVLRSSIREFLCSEAMYHLGAPTTRALSLVTTGEQVVRDMFYNGNPKLEPGAIVCRVAESFLRFGHFQILTAQGNLGLLQKLLDYTINNHFAHLGKPSVETYLVWFAEVCSRTAKLVVEWERVGFVHGVLNTDNMSILGLTIDYGPYGWLENYDPGWTPNTTDVEEKRYRFGNQAACAQWNLWQLANAIYPLIKNAKHLQQIVADFIGVYESERHQMMSRKLGLLANNPVEDAQLHVDLLDLLPAVETDMTIFYRQLAKFDLTQVISQESSVKIIAHFSNAYYIADSITPAYSEQLLAWLQHYQNRVLSEGVSEATRLERMNQTNPNYLLRNYLAQLAIDKAEEGDFSMIHDLLKVLRNPYAEISVRQQYAEKRPDWARQRPGCSMLSCSS